MLPNYANLSGRDAQLKARAAALKALDIDSGLAEPYVTLASLSMDEWNWPEAERRFKRAIELKPGYATAHQWYAECLEALARVPEALVESRKAYELDPLSLSASASLGSILYDGNHYDQANEQFRKTLELAPNFVPAQIHLALSLLLEKKFSEATALIERTRDLTRGAPAVLALLGCAYAQGANASAPWRFSVNSRRHPASAMSVLSTWERSISLWAIKTVHSSF